MTTPNRFTHPLVRKRAPRMAPPRLARGLLAALLGLGTASGCSQCEAPGPDATPPTLDARSVDSSVTSAKPVESAAPAVSSSAAAPARPPCPREMLLIPARKGAANSRPEVLPSDKSYCIDRWEAGIVDKKTKQPLSPYYSPTRKLALRIAERWEGKRNSVGGELARAMPLPPLSRFQRENDVEPMAVSRADQIPHGYLSGKVARRVCENAGKRLCARDEWVRACRGAQDRPFPYGEKYKQGACNIFRSSHPAAVLHDDVTTGHLDPRLNLVRDKKGPLLMRTGSKKTCRSIWGSEALYDMVGNLDEWVDDPDGVFVGGFFSRAKKDGCASIVKNHPSNYFDYSLGVRCCMNPRKGNSDGHEPVTDGP